MSVDQNLKRSLHSSPLDPATSPADAAQSVDAIIHMLNDRRSQGQMSAGPSPSSQLRTAPEPLPGSLAAEEHNHAVPASSPAIPPAMAQTTTASGTSTSETQTTTASGTSTSETQAITSSEASTSTTQVTTPEEPESAPAANQPSSWPRSARAINASKGYRSDGYGPSRRMREARAGAARRFLQPRDSTGASSTSTPAPIPTPPPNPDYGPSRRQLDKRREIKDGFSFTDEPPNEASGQEQRAG
jgi:hypothetical protein